jgi:hypothetical protein
LGGARQPGESCEIGWWSCLAQGTLRTRQRPQPTPESPPRAVPLLSLV